MLTMTQSENSDVLTIGILNKKNNLYAQEMKHNVHSFTIRNLRIILLTCK